MKSILFIAAIAFNLGGVAQAQTQTQASAVSGLSMLPVVVSVAAPAGLLVAGSMFTVAAVETASDATVCQLFSGSLPFK